MKTFRLLIAILITMPVFVSCVTNSGNTVVPRVYSRGNLPRPPVGHFYVMGASHFGVLDLIVGFLQSRGLHAQIVADKRDIPNLRARQYIITHEYDLVSDDNIWRLDIRIVEFNPRGMDNQVAIGTATSSASTRALVHAVMARIL
jgi:hypothetical protein